MNKSKLIKITSIVLMLVLLIGIIVSQSIKPKSSNDNERVAADSKKDEEVTPIEDEQKDEEDLTEDQTEQETEATPAETAPQENTTPKEEPAKQEKPKETVNTSKPKETKPVQEAPKQNTPKPVTPTPTAPVKEEPKQPAPEPTPQPTPEPKPAPQPTPEPAPQPTKTYTGSQVKQQLYGLGFVNYNGGLKLNPYGAEGLIEYDYMTFSILSGEWDMNLSITDSNPEVDQKIRAICGYILPSQGGALYSMLDTPGLSSKTVELDGRKIKISVSSHGIGLYFGPIIK